MVTKQTKQHYTYISALRILAIFFVIFNHSGDMGFYLYTYYPAGSLGFWVSLFVSIFSKVSVPLFFMISGALLLNKQDEPLKDLWGKKIVKMAIPLVAFSLVYYAYALYWSRGPFDLKAFLTQLYASDWMYHLWYMYAYLAYLMCLPFLRSMVQNLPNRYFYYMMVLAVVFNGVLPCLEHRFSLGAIRINPYLQPTWLITNSVLYPCLGYFFQHRVDIASWKKKLPILWGANILGFLISGYMVYFRFTVAGVVEKTEMFHGCFAVLNCSALFLTARMLLSGQKLPRPVSGLMDSMGKCTFGIYLMHLLFKDRPFLVNLVYRLRAIGMNHLLAVMIYCACIFVITYGITFVLSKIPLVRKTVGC